MIFYHTVYENTAAPDPKHMEVILYNNLQNNKFGTLPASTNNFKFNYKGVNTLLYDSLQPFLFIFI